MRLCTRWLLIGGLVSMLFAPSALARPGERTMSQTFPFAARLCQRAQAAQLPRRLASDSAAVDSACAILTTAFTASQATLTSALAQEQTTVANARTQLTSTLVQARQNRDRAAATTAVQAFKQIVQGVVAQRRAAVTQDIAANQAARKAFWGTIRSLPGGRNIPEDSSTPSPTVPPLPTG